jgi:predicted phosphate transport protein (TIGR00153 family)
MRFPFFKLFRASPLEGLTEHMDKVKECGLAFQEAIECHISNECHRFLELKKTVDDLEHQADAIKRRIRGHLPKGTLMPVDKFELFRYLSEQDNVLDAVQDTLDWLSFRMEPGIPEELHRDLLLLVEAALEAVDELGTMVAEARKYFRTYSEDQRVHVKKLIRSIRQKEHDADLVEDQLKEKIFNTGLDGVTVFHMIRLAETIGAIADHAENAGDMMRAMVAR